VTELSFGALATPQAAEELRVILSQPNAELAGKIGGLVAHNEILRSSTEWSAVLKDFIIENKIHGDEVKSRLLQTVEELKTPAVENLSKAVATQTTSLRLRDQAEKILQKNFSPTYIKNAKPSSKESSR
jgi:hypothetical protein